MMQSIDMMIAFSELLHSFWSDYNVMVWILNKPFQGFVGAELLMFIRNAQEIVDFLQSNFIESDTLNDLCDGLLLWQGISPFLNITTIEDADEYKGKMETFTNNLKQFYTIGGRSFLTSNPSLVGNDETFYMHCLRFYLPKIAAHTLEIYKMGISIFTMQGFERRNKESKNILKQA